MLAGMIRQLGEIHSIYFRKSVSGIAVTLSLSRRGKRERKKEMVSGLVTRRRRMRRGRLFFAIFPAG